MISKYFLHLGLKTAGIFSSLSLSFSLSKQMNSLGTYYQTILVTEDIFLKKDLK